MGAEYATACHKLDQIAVRRATREAEPAIGGASRAWIGDTWRRDYGRIFGARSGRRRRARHRRSVLAGSTSTCHSVRSICSV